MTNDATESRTSLATFNAANAATAVAIAMATDATTRETTRNATYNATGAMPSYAVVTVDAATKWATNNALREMLR